jgi:hypothetical protein
LLFQDNNCYINVAQSYVICTYAVLFSLLLYVGNRHIDFHVYVTTWILYVQSFKLELHKRQTFHKGKPLFCLLKYLCIGQNVEWSDINVASCYRLKKKIERPSPYRAVNTFHLGYKNQSVYAVSDISRCLFSDKYQPFKDEAQTALFKNPVRTAL